MNSNILHSLREYKDKLYDILIELDKMASSLKIFAEVEDRQIEKNGSSLEKEELLELRSNRTKLLSASLRVETTHSLIDLVHKDILNLVGDEENEDDENDDNDKGTIQINKPSFFEEEEEEDETEEEEDEEEEDDDDDDDDNDGLNPGLCVYLPDGYYIQEDTGVDTLIAAIEEAGPNRVEKLKIIHRGIPLISNKKDRKYGKTQKKLSNGKLLITHSSTVEKCNLLKRISKELDLDWDVEIIE